MHEIPIVSALVDAAIKTAEEQQATTVKKIHLNIGKLTALNPEQVEFIFNTITKNTILKNAKLIIHLIEPAIQCKTCNYKGELDFVETFHFTSPLITCPRCKSKNNTITQGNECTLTTITIEKN